MYQFLITEPKNHTLVIILNRPKVLNALRRDMIYELQDAIKKFIGDPTLRGAVIIGSGDKAFAAGADISEFKDLDSLETAIEGGRLGQDVFQLIEDAPKPIIAAVNGFALGGGCELAMACHMRIAAENAKFGQPEVKLGLIAGYGGTQRLAQHIGRAKATELLLTADMINAEEALRLGLVNYVVPLSKLTEKCLEVLRKIYEQSPLAVAFTLDAIGSGVKGEDGYRRERENFAKALLSEDGKEGTTAFLEKRKPNFTGK
ncbi:MAG: enoyl-CoA hydratase-related protein [Bacteroidota bacterium]